MISREIRKLSYTCTNSGEILDCRVAKGTSPPPPKRWKFVFKKTQNVTMVDTTRTAQKTTRSASLVLHVLPCLPAIGGIHIQEHTLMGGIYGGRH
jgi:hypothetical protein